jgi:hypothetical protein
MTAEAADQLSLVVLEPVLSHLPMPPLLAKTRAAIGFEPDGRSRSPPRPGEGNPMDRRLLRSGRS